MIFFEALASGGGSDWYYTVLMKAPLGAEIILDDNDEEVTATGAGTDTLIGIPVHNPSSAYELTVKMNGLTAPTQTVNTPVNSGAISDVITVNFANIHIVYDDNFRGQDLSITDGTHTASPAPKIPTTGNVMDIYVPYTGDWTLEATDPVSGDTFNSSPNPVPITSLTQSINVGLYVIPDGETVTPTDDIETWLLCADIKDTGYTTLEEVLNDEEVLIKVLTDENATQYLKRSKTFINAGLVPTLSSDNGKIYTAGQTFVSGQEAWKAFDGDPSTWASVSTAAQNAYLGYIFDDPVEIKKVKVSAGTNYSSVGHTIEYSDDSTNWTLCSETVTSSSEKQIITIPINSGTGAHRYWRLKRSSSTAAGGICYMLQFFQYAEGITENELAMQAIGSYDVAANILLSDSDWREAIAESDYHDSILQSLVPIMTSNTTPSGTADGKSYRGTNNEYFRAFNGDDGNGWLPDNSDSVPWYVNYTFEEKTKVYAVGLLRRNANAEINAVCYINGYDDASNKTKISNDVSFNIPSGTAPDYSTIIPINNPDEYLTYELYYTTDYNGGGGSKLWLYGRAGGIQDWLKAAGLTKPYTTLQEVLNDPNTLSTLVTNHDAVDYLVTAKALIDDICADETAMRYIGKRNYCADTLLADEDWANGILNSAYKDSVLNASVPTMNGPTSPSGEAKASSQYSNSNAAYMAFDKNTSTNWAPSNATGASWLQYEFGDSIKCHFIKYYFEDATISSRITSAKFQASNDPNFLAPVDLTDAITSFVGGAYAYIKSKDSSSYKYFRFVINNATNYPNTVELDFIGRSDVDESKIDIYGAVQDTILATDENGNTTPITTGNDSKYTIDKSDLPNGDYVFTSSITKNPVSPNLADDFSKRVKITNDTVEVRVMPQGEILYWYGTKGKNLEEMSAANGWSVYHSSYAFYSPTYNQRDILIGGQSVINQQSGIGTKNKMKAKVLEFIARRSPNSSSPTNNSPGIYGIHDTKISSGSDPGLIGSSTNDGLLSRLVSETPMYYSAWGNRDNSSKISAFMLDNPDITPTYLSAANDILYILDGNTQIPIATTNAAGKSYDLMLPPGTYDIYSSVAKDPDDLTSPYHKTVTITTYTRTVKVMPVDPENIIYWYGYHGEKWSNYVGYAYKPSNSGRTVVVPTITTALNYIREALSNDLYRGLGAFSPIDITDYTKINGIFYGDENHLNNNGRKCSSALEIIDPFANGYTKISKGGDIVDGFSFVTVDVSQINGSRNIDVFISTNGTNNAYHDMYALWLEGPSIYSNFFSAANDTVYYTENGVDIVVAETNGVGEARVNFSQIPTGVTLKSTVADDPDDLTSKFSKVFNGPNADGKFYLMPEDGDKMLYWYGWTSDGLELMSSTNGWGDPSNTYSDTTTFEANDIQMSAETSKYTGCATKNTIKASNVYAICEGITGLSNIYGYLVFVGDKGQTSQLISDRTNMSCKSDSLQLLSGSTTPAVDGYLGVKAAYSRSMKAYAFWYE